MAGYVICVMFLSELQRHMNTRKGKILIFEDIPAWSKLRFEPKTGNLTLKLHRGLIFQAPNDGDLKPWFGVKQNEEQLPLFKEDLLESRLGKERFGYRDDIVLVDEDASWYTYQITLPQFYINEEYCWGNMTRICKPLSVLLRHTECSPLVDTDSVDFQDFVAIVGEGTGRQNSFVAGTISPSYMGRLRRIFEVEKRIEIPLMTEAMKSAHKTMFGENKDYYRHNFRSMIEKSGPYLTCPGDACEVHPEYHSHGVREGMRLVDHNVDNGIQQFTLLYGLAAMGTALDEMSAQ